MLGLRRFVAPVALLAVALMLGGCFKLDQKLFVLADGSGKLVLLFGAKEMEELKDFGMGMEPDVPDGSPDDLDSTFEGYAAATMPKTWEKDGWKFTEFTIYFDDINKFKMIDESGDAFEEEGGDEDGGMGGGDGMEGEGEAEVPTTYLIEYRFEKAGDGHRLTVTNKATAQIGDADAGGGMSIEDAPEEARAMMEMMMARMLEGFGITESYTLPGDVSSAEGLPKKSGRTASLEVTAEDIKTAAKRATLGKATSRTVVCGPSSMSADDIKAFKDEMARAKAEWAKLRAAASESDK